ncbi:precursor of CEP3-like [Abrus precatorius]|uniref:Precursor of CEP3-like n=1 Tax=Abrus precatorius TaxID=3816 RepID=A0A8B8KT52_ABRPR|nr:precursor of CEP3-like [Abrus precatorius]
MAQNKFIFSMIFLALIIFSQQFQSIEGRYLKYDKGYKDHDEMHGGNSATNAATSGNVSSPAPSTMVGATGAAPPHGHDVDDFRPTTPGHSPGVGHSINN